MVYLFHLGCFLVILLDYKYLRGTITCMTFSWAIAHNMAERMLKNGKSSI